MKSQTARSWPTARPESKAMREAKPVQQRHKFQVFFLVAPPPLAIMHVAVCPPRVVLPGAAIGRALWRFCEAKNLDAETLFKSCGLDPSLVHESRTRYPFDRLCKAWIEAATILGSDGIGLEAAQYFSPLDLNALGVTFLSSANLTSPQCTQQVWGRSVKRLRRRWRTMPQRRIRSYNFMVVHNGDKNLMF